MNNRHDLERREQDRTRLLEAYRNYVDQNSPPIMSDLKNHIKPLLEFGYANLPELLNIVNAKIFPMRVVTDNEGNLVHGTNLLEDLKLVDTRDNEDTLRSWSRGGLTQRLMNVKSTNGRKYIVEGGIKHWIPDSETKNALGLESNSFIQLADEKLNKLEDGENIQSVKSTLTRLVRTKNNRNDVFVIFTWPETHRRHVPDQATLTAMHRRQDQVELIDEKQMSNIPEKEALNPVSKWDPKIIKSIPQSSPQNVHHYYGPVANTGSDIKKVIQENTWKSIAADHPFKTVLAVLGSIASIVGVLLYFL